MIKNVGILFLIAGVAILVATELSTKTSNTMLMISAGLIIFGLFIYIILNRIIEE